MSEPAGYSGTPLAKKLGVKPGSNVFLHEAPAHVLAAITEEGARIADGPVDVAVVFAAWERNLVATVAALRERLTPAAGLWMAWPKKSSKLPTDLTEDRLRALWLPTGLVDNKVCAIDADWSGLRFVLRKELRP